MQQSVDRKSVEVRGHRWVTPVEWRDPLIQNRVPVGFTVFLPYIEQAIWNESLVRRESVARASEPDEG
jgi:hypothetical protein